MNFTLGKCSPAVIGGENAILHNFTFVNGKKFPHLTSLLLGNMVMAYLVVFS